MAEQTNNQSAELTYRRRTVSPLVIVSVSHPESAVDRETQRVARSHTTREQHKRRRQLGTSARNVTNRPETSDDSQRSASSAAVEPALENPASGITRSQQFTFVPTTDLQLSNQDSRHFVRSHVASYQHRMRRIHMEDQANERPNADSRKLVSSSSSKAKTKKVYLEDHEIGWKHPHVRWAAQNIANLVLQDEAYRTGVALDRLGFDLNMAMEHYGSIVSARALGVSESYAETMTAIIQSFWIPSMLSDPAPAVVLLLISVMSNLASLGIQANVMDVMRPYTLTINAVQSALDDPRRATSNQTIMCVANMALQEALYGCTAVCHMHLQGLVKIVELRGGLDNLGMNGVIEQIVLWFDNQCAAMAGSRPYYWNWITKSEGMVPEDEHEVFERSVTTKLKQGTRHAIEPASQC